jgi:hypothetical protein
MSTSQQPLDTPQPKRQRKVAVVAVHGVGVHPPGENQNDMADLLLSLPPRAYTAPRTYEPFQSVGIQIPLEPLRARPFDRPGSPESAEPVPPPSLLTRIVNLYAEQSADFAQKRRKQAVNPKANQAPADSVGEAGRRYTQMLLEDYQGGSEVGGNKYVTARLEGRRIADGSAVHIYEVLWADLAKPSNTVLKFFLGLFQVLLHLASLSRTAIDTGSAEGTGAIFWLFRRCQRYAVRLLLIFAPVLQLLVVVSVGSCLSTASDHTRDKPVIPLAYGVIAGILFGLIFITWIKNKIAIGPWLWSLLAVLPALIGLAIPLTFMHILGHYGFTPADQANLTAAVGFWLLPGVGLFAWILSNYEDLRKGVQATGFLLFAAAFIYFVVALWVGGASIALAAFWTSKIILGCLRFCWFLLISLAFAALILGSIAWRSQRDPGRRARARAAVRTSRFAFALPCISFSLITLAIWASLIHLMSGVSVNPIFPDYVVASQLPQLFGSADPHSFMGWVQTQWHAFGQLTYASGDNFTVRKPSAYIPVALAYSVGYQLPVSLALVAFAGFLLTWWALPSALTERFPYRNDAKDSQHSGVAPRDTDNATSLHMGTWLSRGLDSTSVITFLLWTAMFFAPAAWILLHDFAPAGSALSWALETLRHWTVAIVYSQMLAASIVLAGIARSGGVVLGIVLDVDTYLRETPREAPPRARIFERYISTLRYLNAYRDADGQPYDEIVIVAHSLGALISGDILHFLQSDYSLEPPINVPIKLLTLGNPTRQLLNRFFPYLYDWIKAIPDNGACPLPMPTLTPPAEIAIDARPNPRDLGLTHWVSAYRSGDYVGRSLWLDEWYLRTAPEIAPAASPLVIASSDNLRAEMCIGAGAHTHYMDDTAPDIAWMLDQLI